MTDVKASGEANVTACNIVQHDHFGGGSVKV